jgi:Kae1-associated kinase Bud32
MHIINRGAEAVIYLDEFEGQKVLVKERIKKNYRIREIDEKIRINRARREVRLLREARMCGVPTPKVLKVDEESCKIIMEYVGDNRVKEILLSSKKSIAKICGEIGALIGKLHAHDIVHGDLTTSNMLLWDGKIYFIDFGLGEFSKRTEDKGIDLKLLQEALKSTHYKILNQCWQNIIKGYKEEYKDAQAVIEKVDEIEKRARYVQRKNKGQK